jgi:hypothetical protein
MRRDRFKEKPMTATVAIRLNKRRLIENFRFAFPNRYSVVTELLQNARRAGASCVTLTYEPRAKRLVVRDDGCGISDFQTLLTLGESGWSEKVQRTEQPFGLGFLQSLYAAGSCCVESGGQRVRFDTRAALAGAMVGVERGTDAPGTTVTLETIELPHLDREIVRMTRGFPVPVQYNGVTLRRLHAPDALPYVDTSIGTVYLAGLDDGAVTRETAVYLQGLMIEGPVLLGLPCNVVHLDPVAFQARLPDRDCLMDQDAALHRVELVLGTLWRDRLIAAKRVATPEVFAERCFRAATLWGHLDLFNDLPVLPEGLLERIDGYPRLVGYDGGGYLVPFRRALTRAEVESGRLRLACLGAFSEDTATRWMYARERAYFVVGPSALDGEHWVHAHVRELEEEEVSVETITPGLRTTFRGRRIEIGMLTCEAVEIRVGGDRVVICDDAVYRPVDNTLLVPEGEFTGKGVRQVSSYVDGNGDWCEADERADSSALAEAIALLRSPDPAGALLRLIAEARPERYPSLRGKRFTVEVGDTPQEHRVAAESE